MSFVVQPFAFVFRTIGPDLYAMAFTKVLPLQDPFVDCTGFERERGPILLSHCGVVAQVANIASVVVLKVSCVWSCQTDRERRYYGFCRLPIAFLLQSPWLVQLELYIMSRQKTWADNEKIVLPFVKSPKVPEACDLDALSRAKGWSPKPPSRAMWNSDWASSFLQLQVEHSWPILFFLIS